jgi:hypothetical protein
MEKVYQSGKEVLYFHNGRYFTKSLIMEVMLAVENPLLLAKATISGGIIRLPRNFFIFSSSAEEDGYPVLFISTNSVSRAITIAIRKFAQYNYVGNPILILC